MSPGNGFTIIHDLVSNVFAELTGLSFEQSKYHGCSYETWTPGPESGYEDPSLIKPTEEEFNNLFNQKCAEDPSYAMAMLRFKRDNLLGITDYMFVGDFQHKTEEIKQKWLEHRRLLRELPDTANPTADASCLETLFPKNVTWPESPTEDFKKEYRF
jgi:hypothetical protein